MQVRPIRLPLIEAEAVQAWAAHYGRTWAEEVRLAIRLLLLTHSLAYLQTELGAADVAEQGLDLAEEVSMVERELEVLTVEADTPAAAGQERRTRVVPTAREPEDAAAPR